MDKQERKEYNAHNTMVTALAIAAVAWETGRGVSAKTAWGDDHNEIVAIIAIEIYSELQFLFTHQDNIRWDTDTMKHTVRNDMVKAIKIATNSWAQTRGVTTRIEGRVFDISIAIIAGRVYKDIKTKPPYIRVARPEDNKK